jgi:hypothetical protein
MENDPRFILRPFDKREGMSLSAAAKHAGRSPSTMRNWCEEHGIGRRVAGGNWVVSRVALQMLLDGETDALFEYHTGNRAHPVVAMYFGSAGLKCLISQNQQTEQTSRGEQSSQKPQTSRGPAKRQTLRLAAR